MGSGKKEKTKKKKSKKIKNPKKEKKLKKAKSIKHEIKLRIAKKKDFLEVDKHYIKNGKKKTKWKLRVGVPFWMYNSKGEIENKNYIMHEDFDLDDLGIYLSKEQILIPLENERKKRNS